MITGECDYCESQRFWKLAALQHQHGCPAYGRRPQRLDAADTLLFGHPDLVELDLEITAWYPELVLR